ncbi:sensor histidine kinase [Streptomyces sp. NPDC058195]|uniref:sensor histidine kinase n=1 Tax=Streptomyces sp. NPDC058195 TaxID=3346375 RepID=UPI0036EE8467
MFTEGRPWLRRHPRTAGVMVAVLLWGVAVFASTLADGRIIRAPRPEFVLAALVPSAILLLGHRRYPRLTVVATTVIGGALGLMGGSGSGAAFDPNTSVVGAALVALYLLAQRTTLRTAAVYTVGTTVALLLFSTGWGHTALLRTDQLGLVSSVLLAGALGELVRSRRDHLAAVEARAELAERTREEEARRRVGEERTRIARELHDIVAHRITLAHAQAATAAYLLRSKPDQAQRTLDQLAGTTSSALREMKATVGLLRREGDPETPLEPAPGLDRLPELIASFEQAGLAVSVRVEGEARPLPPGADLTAYRVVQEALTNVTKHAGGANASVRLVYAHRVLTLTVSDDGHAPPATGTPGYGTPGHGTPGYGLIGMRERARSAGGRLAAGHRPGGGFEVSTELPLEEPAGPEEPAERGGPFPGPSGGDDERTAR